MDYIEVSVGDETFVLTWPEARTLRDELSARLGEGSDIIGRVAFDSYFTDDERHQAGRLWGVLTRHGSPFRLDKSTISGSAIIEKTGEFLANEPRGVGRLTAALLWEFRERLLT